MHLTVNYSCSRSLSLSLSPPLASYSHFDSPLITTVPVHTFCIRIAVEAICMIYRNALNSIHSLVCEPFVILPMHPLLSGGERKKGKSVCELM